MVCLSTKDADEILKYVRHYLAELRDREESVKNQYKDALEKMMFITNKVSSVIPEENNKELSLKAKETFSSMKNIYEKNLREIENKEDKCIRIIEILTLGKNEGNI